MMATPFGFETDVGEKLAVFSHPSDGEENGATAEADVHVVYNYFDVEVVPRWDLYHGLCEH